MNSENIRITREIYEGCCQTLVAAIEGIPHSQLTWKPASESRSIAEICRHVIRVDGWFLRQIGLQPAVDDPGSDVLAEIQAAMSDLQNQIRNLLDELKSDEELKAERRAPESEKPHSIDHVVKHISQHYLYHASQIIYLRRAQDRTWEAPTKIWESAVNTISDFTWKGRAG